MSGSAGLGTLFEGRLEKGGLFGSLLVVLSGWGSLLLGAVVLARPAIPLLLFLALAAFLLSLFLILFLLKTLWVHFFAEALGGVGTIRGFIERLAHAALPLHLFLPVSLIASAFAPMAAFPLLFLILYWSGARGMKAVEENYALSGFRAVLAGWSPLFALLLLALFAAAALFAALGQSSGSLFKIGLSF